MTTIETGTYVIINVRQQNCASLPDPNDGTPVAADSENSSNKQWWKVTKLGNGKYTFKNVGADMFAVVGTRAAEGAVVEGRERAQQWDIQETRVPGQFIISTTDTYEYWSLVDNEQTTPVSLSSIFTDARNRWIFKNPA